MDRAARRASTAGVLFPVCVRLCRQGASRAARRGSRGHLRAVVDGRRAPRPHGGFLLPTFRASELSMTSASLWLARGVLVPSGLLSTSAANAEWLSGPSREI